MNRKGTRALYKAVVSSAPIARALAAVAILTMAAAFCAPPASAQAHTNSNRGRALDPAPLPAPIKTYGSKTAPIRIEVFSDYECPACGNFYRTTLRQMISDYVAAGKVYLVHRDFPLSMHQYSYQAARWVNAAGRIGKFAEVEEALFNNQVKWTADGDMQKFISAALSPHDFARLQKLMTGCEAPPAAQATSQNCSLDTFINQDLAMGKQIPITQTPTFVIYDRGQKISTVPSQVSWDILKKFIDSLPTQ